MQSNITSRWVVWLQADTLLKSTVTSHLYQVRNHVKMYPWRRLRNVRESSLDNTRTPYTDKHNINEFRYIKSRLKPWMEVTCKNKENRFNRYHWNENYTSDPKEAKETAMSRFQRFQQSLKDRGEAREKKPYKPPADVNEQIISIYRSLANETSETSTSDSKDVTNDQDIMSIDLNRSKDFKFNFITRCISSFKHDVPGSYLNDIETIGDVVEYFSTEVRGINPFESLINKDELPHNLSILAEPDRYNKEADTMFKNLNAMPGIISKVPGLRAKKKYPVLNQDEFQWPDI
uniref:Large ribosomal subunit protein mL50 n=1 Tax=Aceria tosichella TaxID=561515 RepID=A0A6G1SGA5_9ACAR